MIARVDEPQQPAPLPSGRFSGRREFQQLVRDAFECAAREGWKEMVLCDADFLDWPLGERAVIDTLNAWATGGGRLTLLARRYEELRVAHPRFVRWRTLWSHLIEARGCRQADPLDLPSVLWSPGWVLHRIDPARSQGVTSAEPERRVVLHETLSEWLRHSAPAFPATTLGL